MCVNVADDIIVPVGALFRLDDRPAEARAASADPSDSTRQIHGDSLINGVKRVDNARTSKRD